MYFLPFFFKNVNIIHLKISKKKDVGDLFRDEAPVGFEPTNKAFAELRLKPLGYSAVK